MPSGRLTGRVHAAAPACTVPHRGRTPRRAPQRGFTLVELVVVMLLMALLASVGASRFASTEAFAAQGLADRLASGLRTAQATAMAQRRTVYVQLTLSPPAMSVCLDAGCAQAIAPSGTDSTWLPAAAGLSLDGATNFSFGPDGATSLPGALDLRVLGGSAPTPPAVRVEAATGLVTRS